MPPSLRDASYVWDIIQAARDAIDIAGDLSPEDYAAQRKTRLAVERCIEIIGEATRRLSDEFKAAHPDVPWQKIVGQRNVLAHDYRDIQHEKVLGVVSRDLPALAAALEGLLPPPPET